MTTNTDPTARAAQYRTAADDVFPFSYLPVAMRAEIEFVVQSDGSALAIWRDDGEGEEPPPYWMDVDGKIHKL
jgi:hypothetical protein